MKHSIILWKLLKIQDELATVLNECLAKAIVDKRNAKFWNAQWHKGNNALITIKDAISHLAERKNSK